MTLDDEPKCYDCDLLYIDGGWEDFIVSNHIWKTISPAGDTSGLLCVTCIIRRLNEKGMHGIIGAFMSGPIDTVTQHSMETFLIAERALKLAREVGDEQA